jgi:alginate O-acetyltransferase complex protein AlgI
MGLNNFFFIVQFVILFIFLSVLQIIRSKWLLEDIGRVQIFILLFYSYYFVGSVNWRFAVCVALVTIIAYGGGQLIERAKQLGKPSQKVRKIAICVWGGVILILVYFKYMNFFIESANKVIGLNIGTLKIILPIGISFFTFSALSYVIDVYRGICDAEKNIVDFGVYMAFFPKITAGPIVRWTEFKPQLKKYRGIKLDSLSTGIQIFVFGLFKKMVLADHLGVFVDDVFRTPEAFNTGTVVLSAISYSLQIYLDFSGYSDMAIGLAKILGFEFKANFNLPYLSRGFSDFWSRWHISLSQWFRDYLYIPLGGCRKGEQRTYINLLIIMFISGLWHGAGWTFILWGLLHGIASCATRFIKKSKGNQGIDTSSAITRIIEAIVTFVFATLFWTIFRAESIEKVGIYWKALFTVHSGISQPYIWTFISVICVGIATIIAIVRAYKHKNKEINGFYPIFDLSKVWSLIIFFTFCGLTILLGYYGNTAFIYGAF